MINLPQGDAWQRLYGFLPWWFLATCAWGAVAFALWRVFGSRSHALWPRAAQRFGSVRGLAILVGYCGLLLAVCDSSGFLYGFFRQDDFSFLQVTREDPGIGQQMLLLHNDHLYPLYRLQVWLLVQLAGPNADAPTLAAWFNGFNYLACVSLLLAGCWTLHELGASRTSLFAFAFFTWLWPGWGEFTAGFYTLSAYLQIQALAFGATAAVLRGLKRGSPGWLGIGLLLAATASLIGTAGVYVGLAVGTVALAGFRGSARPVAVRKFLLGLAALFILLGAFYFFAGRHERTARELVQNPGAVSLGLSTFKGFIVQFPAVCLAGVTAIPGVMLSLVAPTFLQMAVNGEQVAPALYRSFLVLQVLGLVILVLIGVRQWPRLLTADRPLALALALNAFLCFGMVLLARTAYAVAVPVPLWQAKYLIMPFTWTMLALVFLADRLWFSAERTPSWLPAISFAAVVAGCWLHASFWHLERTVLPEPLAYVARGRWGNVNNAEARALQFHAVLTDLQSIARQRQNQSIVLPDPESWAPVFYARFPLLEWGGESTPRGVTYLFGDMLAASPVDNLSTQMIPIKRLTPSDRAFLTRIPWLAPLPNPNPDSSRR